jgi:hypothetical protein
MRETTARPTTDRDDRPVSGVANLGRHPGARAIYGEDDMIGVNVTFDYNGDFDRSRVMTVAENARTMFEGMPGLRFKFFTFDEKNQRATNFYVWDSKEVAERFFSDELRERVTGLYGIPPTITFVDIAQIVDNTSS